MDKFRLILKSCTRCQNEFYTTHVNEDIYCPFCGYSFESAELVRRVSIREHTAKDCILSNGFGKLSVTTVDVCKQGVGIRMGGELPFDKNDKLNIAISDLDMNYPAEVMWVANSLKDVSRAGLKLLDS